MELFYHKTPKHTTLQFQFTQLPIWAFVHSTQEIMYKVQSTAPVSALLCPGHRKGAGP